MAEILESQLETNKNVWEVSRQALDDELLLKPKVVPEALKKERASYEILGITNVQIEGDLESVTFDYNGASFNYECWKGKERVTMTNNNGEYAFQFLNPLYIENVGVKNTKMIEDANKKTIAINGVSEFPKAFANSLAILIGGSTCLSCTGATKTDFLKSVMRGEEMGIDSNG